MSFLPPFGEMHNLTAMALGGAAGSGMDPFVTNKQYALMGDSTFFWRGMTAISNSIKEAQDILYIILENKNTAMTGHQPTPESGHNIMGDKTTAQDIESIVRAMGQDQIYVRKMPPSNREKYMKELDKDFAIPGVKVVIADKECGITFHKRKRAERNRIIDRQGFIPREEFVNISQEVCENCRECTKNTGCPGLTIIDTDYGEKIGIDQSTCVSDTYCTKIMACPSFEKVIVTRNKPPRPRVKKIALDNIPPPARHEFSDTWSAFISGVGGMGVGVLSSTLARAGALYELQVDHQLDFTPTGTGVSSGVHESQSRFWENIVGRSRQFTSMTYPLLKTKLSFLSHYDESQVYSYFNTVRPSLIRVEADELTYNFHIAMRYELEKKMLQGTVQVSELPSVWNDMIEEYLGKRPSDDAQGVLQDVHWSWGQYANFPGYSLGNVIAGMLWNTLTRKQLLPIKGDKSIPALKGWLAENVQKHGATYPPKELLNRVFGHGYDPAGLVSYLENKYLAAN